MKNISSFLILCFQFLYVLSSQGDMIVNGNLISGKSVWTNRLVTGSVIASQFISEQSPLSTESLFAEQLYSNEVEVGRIIASSPDGVILFNGDITVQNLEIKEETDLPVTSFVNRWHLAYHDHFDTKNTQGWNVSTVQLCQGENSAVEENESDYFIGGHCVGNSDLTLSKTFTELPKHKHTKISARIHFFDNWEGETLSLLVDGKLAWSKTAEQKDSNVNVCGGRSADPHFGIPLEVNIPHTGGELNLLFQSDLTKDRCTASFAVDDVEIFVK